MEELIAEVGTGRRIRVYRQIQSHTGKGRVRYALRSPRVAIDGIIGRAQAIDLAADLVVRGAA